ncbi:hypothetical protein [Micromonospora purpureochromogenes]|uniref:hypothetical protein n=1 Tax=Micromonospora purpureochromogenes TaxID=47872 RepID=UPI0012FDC814|nr:hypothetical protein [Micromonospora purpureochromogenes]
MSSSQPVGPNALADAVRDELVAAGLPVLPWEPSEVRGTGVSILADADDPEVWIGWVESEAMRNAAITALQAGAYRPGGSEVHPALRHSSTVTSAMLAAIAEILVAVGFHVETDADDMRPSELLVRGRQPGPSWRDPAVPPLAGSSGYGPGVRVRLIEGDYAGAVTTVMSARWHNRRTVGPPDLYRVEHPRGTGQLDVPATAVTLAQEES